MTQQRWKEWSTQTVDELRAALQAVLEAHEQQLAQGGQVYTDADAIRAALARNDIKA